MSKTMKIKKSSILGSITKTEWKNLSKEMTDKGFTLKAPYQEDGVRWMLQRERSKRPYGLLCDEPGLGKTIQTIATMIANPKERTLLAVPTCVLKQWEGVLNILMTGKVYIYHGPNRPRTKKQLKHLLKTYPVILTTLGMIRQRKILHKIRWNRFIIDECHYLNNEKTNLFQSACDIRAKIRWGLTGTPIQNNMDNFINLGAYLKCCNLDPDNIKKYHFLRRTKAELSEIDESLKMPDLHIRVKKIELSDNEKKAHDEVDIVSNYVIEKIIKQNQVEKHSDIVFPTRNGNTESTKFKALIEDILSHPEDQSLIFCEYICEIQLLQKELEKVSILNDVIRGSISQKKREKIIKDCRDQKINTLILQINTAAVGLNLQFANRIYFVSPTYNPTLELQAIARAHRIGQTKPVYVTKYVSTINKDYTVDERKLEIQEVKNDIIQNFLKDVSPIITHKSNHIHINAAGVINDKYSDPIVSVSNTKTVKWADHCNLPLEHVKTFNTSG